MAEINIKEMNDYIDRGLMEIAGLTSRREYNLSIVRSRQLADKLIRCYAEEQGIEYTSFGDTIETLYKSGVIDRGSRDAYHSIRMFGNKAVQEGDDVPEDAQNAYYLLKSEAQTFRSRKKVNVDRTPVRVERDQVSNQRPAYSEDGNIKLPRRREPDEERRPNRNGANRSRSTSSKPGSNGRRPQGKRNNPPKGGFDVYSLLRILVPVIAVILIIIIVRSVFTNKKPAPAKTTAAQIETSAPETTTPAPTTAAPTQPETEPEPVKYRITGQGVNIRFADNNDRIYTQLDKGVEIGAVKEIEGSDFVQFTLDGKSVVVRKDFIEPIQ